MSNYDFTLLKNNLEKKGYKVSIFEDKESAVSYLCNKISQQSVGFGGSLTLHQLNLYAALSAQNKVFWHDEKPANLSALETRTCASRADIYISSVNAISENGEIVNIDNVGNRVSAISYGPAEKYLIIGKNKITANLEAAIYRARNVAAPLNAQRLKRKTPCSVRGDKCYDCNSPERICRNLSILWTKPVSADFEIILINENLGF